MGFTHLFEPQSTDNVQIQGQGSDAWEVFIGPDKLHFQDLAAVDTSGVLYRLARKNSWPSRQQYMILEEIKKAVADKKSVVLTQVLCLQFHTPLRVLRKNYRPILD